MVYRLIHIVYNAATKYMTHHAKRDLTGMAVRRLTTVETFRYWQTSFVLSNNSTLLNRHFKMIEQYRRVVTSFPLLFYIGVPFRVMGHIYMYIVL